MFLSDFVKNLLFSLAVFQDVSGGCSGQLNVRSGHLLYQDALE